MNKKLWSLGLAAMMAISGMALMISACAPDEGDPNPNPDTPVTHTHTYNETVWSKDEHNHWHAATCEHTTETKDLAAHEFVGNTCSTCGYEKAVEVTAKCGNYCPVCGKCIDILVCKEDTEHCGDDLKEYDFEIENCEWEAPLDENTQEMKKPDLIDRSSDPTKGGCVFIQGLGGTGYKMTFRITVDSDMIVTLRIRTAKTGTLAKFTDNMLVTLLDSTGDYQIFDREAYNPAWVKGHDGSVVTEAKRDFEFVNLGCIKLTKGENAITIATIGENSYNLDKMQLLAPADTVFAWNPVDRSADYK